MPHSQNGKNFWHRIMGKHLPLTLFGLHKRNLKKLLNTGSPVPFRAAELRNNMGTRIYPGLAVYRALFAHTPDTNSRIAIVKD